MDADDETTPLLARGSSQAHARQEPAGPPPNQHRQYCSLVGLIPSDIPADQRRAYPRPGPNTLYERARRKRRSTHITYAVTTSLSNTLLLAQVVLGATLTGLGAAGSPSILVTVFGAANTVIAGLVAYLKSRGQPMRTRMFKDDLERVVDEIENSEVMWLGIASGMDGYDNLDDDDEVSVRSEVARLTRLYDRAIRNNTLNNPDMYMGGQSNGSDHFGSFRARAGPGVVPAISATVVPDAPAAPAAAPPVPPADESPAVKKDAASSKDKSPEQTDKPSEPTKDSKPDDEAAGSKDDSTTKAPADDNKKTPAGSTASKAPKAAKSAKAEPPPGVPLGADIDEGPVTAPPKKQDNGADKSAT